MSRNRIADLQLRGNTSPVPVRVYWPVQAASRPVPVLVFCIVGAGAAAPAEATCRGLSEDPGLLVLAVSCRAGAQDGTTVLEWAAEHAVELGADSGRLLVAGQGAGGAVAAAVASRARAASWPAVLLATGQNDADLREAVRRSLSAAGDENPRPTPSVLREGTEEETDKCATRPNFPRWPRARSIGQPTVPAGWPSWCCARGC